MFDVLVHYINCSFNWLLTLIQAKAKECKANNDAVQQVD